ncbi:hypothetical protein EDD86DRAFT_247595 [Gorgonomyces haynaldii]|nr:hypothetical protein EDD86DRAFT_247595 [Gorgonomyces haynaldii]
MSVRYTYVAAVAHGISIQHCLSLSRAIYQQVDKNANKRTAKVITPLAMTLGAMVFITISMLTLMVSAEYLMYSNLGIGDESRYYRNSFLGIAMMTLTAIHAICLVLVLYLTTTVMHYTYFTTAPNFRIWIFASGICLLTDCIINVAASAVFVKHLADELAVSRSVLLYSLFYKYGGPKWALFVGLNIFTLYVLLTGLLFGSNIVILQEYLALDIFFTSSYTAAQDLLQVASTQRDKMFMTTNNPVATNTTQQALK